MSRFTKPLRVSPLPPNGAEWCVIEPFSYDVEFERSNKKVWIPRGFVTDFASIPRIFWLVLPKWGRYGNAAVVHDWLYWEQDRVIGLKDEKVSRKRADQIMLEAMGVLQVAGWQRWPIYGALRAGGWLAWRQNRLNRLSGFARVIEPEKITAEYQHKRPGLLKETARAVTGKRPKLEGIARFPEELAKVVAPAVLARVLGTYGGAEVGYGGDDATLAAELYATGLANAVGKLEDAKEKLKVEEGRRQSLDRQERRLAGKIAALSTAALPGAGPQSPEGQLPADKPGESRVQLEGELAKVRADALTVGDQIVSLENDIRLLEPEVDVERRKAILSALGRLVDAARESLHGDPAMGFMLTLATERIHRLLAQVLDGKEDAEAASSAKMLSQALVARVGRRLGPGGGENDVAEGPRTATTRSQVEAEFLKSAGTVLTAYGSNRASLELIQEWLLRFEHRKKAVGHLPRLEELRNTKDGSRVAEDWDLIETTRDLAKDVGALRSGLQSAQLGAMVKQLESAGVPEILQAWALVSRRARADEDGATERDAAAASPSGLCLAIADGIADKLGLDPKSRLPGELAREDDSDERKEPVTKSQLVERIATSRLLVEHAECLLGKESPGFRVDDLVRFYLGRRTIEQRAAKRFRRDRRALWGVLLPLAPVIWLVLRKSMESLRGFFGKAKAEPEAEPKPKRTPPVVYQELGRLARAVLLLAGCGYGLLAAFAAALFFWQFRPVAADPTNPWLLGFVGANFLGCCLYLLWQAVNIRLSGGQGS